MAVDAGSLVCAWSVVTFTVPRAPGQPEGGGGVVPLALGARWLAYAANQVGPCGAAVPHEHVLSVGALAAPRGEPGVALLRWPMEGMCGEAVSAGLPASHAANLVRATAMT